MTIKKIILSLALIFAFTADIWAQSAIYACGHIRRERATAIPKLKTSGYTTVILFNLNVEADASLCTDYDWASGNAGEAGGIVCKGGEYVFGSVQPHFIDDVKSLLTPPTSVNRIEICIGGWTNGSYGHIRNLINTYGTGEDTELYRNFKALHEALPEIVAVNDDQEQDYDVEAATAFHRMLAKIGFKTSVAPYTNKSFWQQLVANLNQEPGTVDMVYLQTYAGGAGNRPADWDVFGDIPMWVGFDCEASGDIEAMKRQMENFRDTSKACGGFLWNYNSEARNVNEWATAINRIFYRENMTDEERGATLYDKANFGGYSVSLVPRTYTQADLAVHGFMAKSIMSVRLTDGYKITLNSGIDMNGNLNEEFTENVSSLSRTWTSQGVGSVKIERYEKENPDDTGVTDMTDDSVPAVIYDLSGRKIENADRLPSGIYIMRKGSKTTKIIK